MAEPTKSIKELIIGLYAVIGASMGNRSQEVKNAALNPALQPWFPEITYLKEALAEVARGKNFRLTPLGGSLRTYSASYSKDPRSTTVSVAILKAMGLWMRAGSPSAWKVLEKSSSMAAFPDWVPQLFSKKVKSQAPIRKALESLVSTITGQRNQELMLTMEQSAAAKKKYPELYKQYLGLRKEFNTNWKDAMSQFVLDSGGRLVDYEDLMGFFLLEGIETSLPTGFTGKIDALGKVYNDEGKLIAGGLPAKVMFPTVIMNESGKGDWIYQAIRADGTPGNYFYLVETNRQKRKDKFDLVRELAGKIDSIRSRWVAGIKKYEEEVPQTVAAVVLELLYTFSARIGSKGNTADGEPTYGLGTLQCKHVKLTPGGFIMQYSGKDGVPTKHVYKGVDPVGKLVVAAIHELMSGKKPNDPLFTYKTASGDRKKLMPSVVNSTFRALGSGKATVHKLRTLRGTTIFRTEMEKLFAKKKSMSNISEAMAFFNEIGVQVGAALNHVRRGTDGSTKITHATAVASYIDVSVQVEFFDHYNLPLPAFLSKRTIESAVIASADTWYDEDPEEMDASLIDDYLSGERDCLE